MKKTLFIISFLIVSVSSVFADDWFDFNHNASVTFGVTGSYSGLYRSDYRTFGIGGDFSIFGLRAGYVFDMNRVTSAEPDGSVYRDIAYVGYNIPIYKSFYIAPIFVCSHYNTGDFTSGARNYYTGAYRYGGGAIIGWNWNYVGLSVNVNTEFVGAGFNIRFGKKVEKKKENKVVYVQEQKNPSTVILYKK